MTNDLSAILARPGSNDVPYVDPVFPDRPLTLRIARPRHCTPDTPVVFVHHGINRNGYDYRDYWLPLVDETGVLVVAPEFSNEHYPTSRWYNFGNLADEEGRAQPRDLCTYAIVGRLFDAMRAAGVTRQPGYGLFGHSAGSQYVHRLLSLGYRDRVIAAVAANAGTYAMPDPAIAFPYGLGGTGVDDTALAGLLGFRLTVMGGTADIDNTSPHFPKEPQAAAQGDTRHARAHRYVAVARKQAQRLGVPCAWTILDVPGVAHEGDRMSAAAAPILGAALHAAARAREIPA
jgi:poly(3-hydroxybutyrate) depolymerase